MGFPFPVARTPQRGLGSRRARQGGGSPALHDPELFLGAEARGCRGRASPLTRGRWGTLQDPSVEEDSGGMDGAAGAARTMGRQKQGMQGWAALPISSTSSPARCGNGAGSRPAAIDRDGAVETRQKHRCRGDGPHDRRTRRRVRPAPGRDPHPEAQHVRDPMSLTRMWSMVKSYRPGRSKP
jgi:hypothetical protein